MAISTTRAINFLSPTKPLKAQLFRNSQSRSTTLRKKTRLSISRRPRPSTLHSTTSRANSVRTMLPYYLRRRINFTSTWSQPRQKRGFTRSGEMSAILITADGNTIVEKRQLHKSIMENKPNSIPRDSTPAGGYHTHVLSDVPEDTDVFHVLTRKPSIPEMIGTTNKKLYEISPVGTIRQGKM